MKNRLTTSIILFFLNGTYAFGQIPQVGETVDFAGVTVRLDAERQQLVQAQINNLLGGSRAKLNEKLERIQLYFPLIVPILEEEGVPNDFKYLVVVESSLLPDVVSTSNAVGYWQMKSGTATDLNLRVDNAIDERKNIFASTVGAAIYLKQINELYKNWISAMAGYRIGRNGVAAYLPSSWRFAPEIDLKNFPDSYIIKALAHKIAFDALVPQMPTLPMALVEYKNAQGKTLRQIAEELNVSESDLQAYNLWLSTNTIPKDKDYSVLAFVSATMAKAIRNGSFLNNNLPKSDIGFPILQRTTQIVNNKDEPIFYQINNKKGILAQTGDNYQIISQRGGIKEDNFLEYNDLNDRDVIIADEVYYLEKKDKKGPVPVHIVREGETLKDIAHIYGVRLERLLKYNRMDNIQRLQIGRVISLQSKSSSDQAEIVIEEKKPDTKPPKEDRKNKRDEKKKEEDKTVIVVDAPKKPEIKEDDKIVVVLDNPKNEDKAVVPSVVINNKPTPQDNPDEMIMLDGKLIKRSELNKPTNGGGIVVINNTNTTRPEPIKPEPPRKEDVKPVVADNRPEPVNPFPDVDVKPIIEEKPSNSITHIVKNGETYFSIARIYKVSPNQIYDWNALAPDIVLFTGQELIIQKVTFNSNTNKPNTNFNPPKESNTWRYHTVKTGENLFRIALNNRVSVEDLRAWNNLKGNSIEIGQELKIKK